MVASNSSPYTAQVQAALRRGAQNMSFKTGGAVDADELFSAAECAVAMSMAEFDPALGFAFEGWACQCGRWAMQNYLRDIDPLTRTQRANGAESSGIVRLDAQPEGFMDRVTDAIEPDRGEVADDLRRVRVLIVELPPKWQAAIRAHYFAGLAPAAIGLQMGCSGQKVSDMLRKGVEKLRELYERRGAVPTTAGRVNSGADAAWGGITAGLKETRAVCPGATASFTPTTRAPATFTAPTARPAAATPDAP